jgi:hypothetical protein
MSAIHVGHHYIEENGIERTGRDKLKRLPPAIRLGDFEAAPLKAASEQHAIVGNIVDDKNARRRAIGATRLDRRDLRERIQRQTRLCRARTWAAP